MSIDTAETVVGVLATYLVLGLVFALSFIAKGVMAIDPQARDMPWTARLLILPGLVALWPLMLAKWLARTPPPES